ncbi:hypothetical protein A2U01_0090776, partial [Trifolium medium]|nr:hypothetical protein [Trifolium medium]
MKEGADSRVEAERAKKAVEEAEVRLSAEREKFSGEMSVAKKKSDEALAKVREDHAGEMEALREEHRQEV